MSNFFEFQANGDSGIKETVPAHETIVQDQDTVIGDAMVETSQLFYETAKEIADCINENCQAAIDCEKIRRAAIALAYMEGVDFGLAMDDEIQKWYLLEMKKSMSTILASQQNAFQTQIYVPIAPWMVMNYDQCKCMGKTGFIHALSSQQPQQKFIDSAKKEIMDNKILRQHLQKMAETEYAELFDVFPELDRPPPTPEKADDAKSDDKSAEDDSVGVLNLRNLYRQNKIDKSQYIGGLATLVATGLISKAEFTRLKTAAS